MPALQVGFKKTLTKEVAAFATDAKAFRSDWQANGPMVPGLAPLEAVERLKKFQQMFDVSALTSVQAALALTPHWHVRPCQLHGGADVGGLAAQARTVMGQWGPAMQR